jgi:hypothetical protein
MTIMIAPCLSIIYLMIFVIFFLKEKDNITTLIELSQLGSIGLSDDFKLYIHKDPISYRSNPKIKAIIDNVNDLLSSKIIYLFSNIFYNINYVDIFFFLKRLFNCKDTTNSIQSTIAAIVFTFAHTTRSTVRWRAYK